MHAADERFDNYCRRDTGLAHSRLADKLVETLVADVGAPGSELTPDKDDERAVEVGFAGDLGRDPFGPPSSSLEADAGMNATLGFEPTARGNPPASTSLTIDPGS